jgi:hypothetical protein
LFLIGCAGTPQPQDAASDPDVSRDMAEPAETAFFLIGPEHAGPEESSPDIPPSLPLPGGVMDPDEPFPEVSAPIPGTLRRRRVSALPEPDAPALLSLPSGGFPPSEEPDGPGKIAPFRRGFVISAAAPPITPADRSAGGPDSPDSGDNDEITAPVAEERSFPSSPDPGSDGEVGSESPPLTMTPPTSPAEAPSAPLDDAAGENNEPPQSVPAPAVSAPPPEVSPTTSERNISYGETVDVELPGPGWLYLGSTGEVEFVSREVDRERDITRFVFRVTGPAILEFESQDLVTGRRQRHEEELLLEEETGGLAASGTTAGGEAPGGDRGDAGAASTGTGDGTSRGRDSASDGAEGADGTEEGADGADREPAETLSVVARMESGETEPPDRAFHEELMRLITEDAQEVRDLGWDALERYLDILDRHGEEESAGELLEALWAAPRWRSDEVLFRLARYYDADRPTRNVRRARDLYFQLVERYPFSNHVEAAENRKRYLDRHFFHIR